MFPGQGAQRLGMGRELFDEFRELSEQADGVLGYSVSTLCLDGPADRLALTRFTQPALYVVGALQYLKHRQTMPAPDYVLGHSVAEYIALFAAEAFDFATGLRLVKTRGELMSRAVGGGMAAVLGLDAEQVAAVLERHAPATVFAANFNTPRQIVISGRRDEIERIEPAFLQAGATYYKPLQVSGAFHTPFMADARDAFRDVVSKISFAPPTIPVIANVTARPHEPGRIGELLIEQITAPVRWSDSIRYLLAKGLAVSDFDEIGPKGLSVVKPMVMRTQIEAGPLNHTDPETLRSEAVDTPALRPPEHEPSTPRPSTPEMPAPDLPARRGNGSAKAGFTIASLGSRAFCDDFNVRYAYLSGGMYQGIASVEVVVRMAKAGLMGFFGTGGLRMPAIEEAILAIQARVPVGAAWGINFIAHSNFPQLEDDLADLLIRHRVRTIEASAFMQVTPALVRYRAKGLVDQGAGRIRPENRIIAKVSRPDVAEQFLSPAPDTIVAKLVRSGAITPAEAEMARSVPMADALSVESDSGGHTDQGMPLTLLPAVLAVRDRCAAAFPDFGRIHVGAAGGIGTPEAAAAMFIMGADFILTGSVNQCTVEAGTSEAVKDLLQEMNVHDTDYAPSGELFELGSKVQVLKKGIFFPARANKLVSLYRQYESIDEIDPKTRQLIQDRYFRRSFADVFAEVCAAYPGAEIERARRVPKHHMALVFKRYFKDATRWALAGNLDHKVDFQVQCGPALGAFNQWVAGTDLAAWRNRHVDTIAEHLMTETAALLNRRIAVMLSSAPT
jgi:trans-AT polyketide synthase/acyltransferase/oxidoreductase domain-containing protein